MDTCGGGGGIVVCTDHWMRPMYDVPDKVDFDVTDFYDPYPLVTPEKYD